MFAIALWDAERKCLLLARDCFGIKPLYYASKNGEFAFASEIRSILHALQTLPRSKKGLASPLKDWWRAEKLPIWVEEYTNSPPWRIQVISNVENFSVCSPFIDRTKPILTTCLPAF